MFTVVVVMALINAGMFNACQKDDVIQNETVLSKQGKSCQNHFVLMTESERQYLIANGESITIDDFKLHAVEIITSKVGQFLVTTVENGKVYFMGISATGNQASWYNRLHEHFISHPSVDPDEPRPDGCTAWTDITNEEGIEAYNEKYELLLEMGLDIVHDCYIDGEGNIWIWACNGTCVC
jgi:hypothetical protein